MKKMVRLVYASKVRLDKLTSSELAHILMSSRTNNQSADITGLLLSNMECFLQVLEGPEHAVQALFTSIKSDPRHYSVTLIYELPITRRLFHDWAMGFSEITGEHFKLRLKDWTSLTPDEADAVLAGDMEIETGLPPESYPDHAPQHGRL